MEGLRFYRERAGMSVYDLADLSGVNRKTIQRSESGQGSPSIRTLERMVVPLGVSVVEVLAAEDALSGQPADGKCEG